MVFVLPFSIVLASDSSSTTDDIIEILGNSTYDAATSRIKEANDIVKDRVYKIISCAGTTWSASFGATNNNVNTFFKANKSSAEASITSPIAGTQVYEAFEVKADDLKSGWVDIIGVYNLTNSTVCKYNISSDLRYFWKLLQTTPTSGNIWRFP